MWSLSLRAHIQILLLYKIRVISSRFFFFQLKWFLQYRIELSLFFHVFIVNLLRRVIISLKVNFFVYFRVNSSDDKIRSVRIIITNHIHQYEVDLEF